MAALTRFVVIGQHRTGTNLLASYLNHHERVVAFGEICAGEDELSWGSSVPRDALPPGAGDEVGGWAARRNADPVGFLETFVFGAPGEKGRDVRGFKLLYEHAWKGRLRAVRDWIEAGADLRILHLKRLNPLRTFASRQVAHLTGVYTAFAEPPEEVSATAANPRVVQLQRFFERTAIMEREHDYLLRRSRVIPLYYEDIERNPQVELDRVFRFLEVAPAPVSTSLRKLNPRPLREMLGNYDELKTAFQKSHWLAYFEE